MTSPPAFKNTTLAHQPGVTDNLTTDALNMTHISVQPSTQHNSRPDWILYTVPSFAFLLGLYLFSMLLIKHRRREKRIIREERLRKLKQAHCRLNGFRRESEKKTEELNKVQLAGAQSYENLEAVIYSNQEGVFYRVPQEAEPNDYVTPDTEGCDTDGGRGGTQDDVQYICPFQNVADTDGESYENMENPLYARPCRKMGCDSQDGDYIHPENGTCEGQEISEKPNTPLTDTDEESYENMDNLPNAQPNSHVDPCRPRTATTVPEGEQEEEEDEDSYVKMSSIT